MFCRFICAQALHSAGVLLILSLTPAQTLAGQGNLAWDYSTTGAAGFALYCGTGSGQYSQRINAGMARRAGCIAAVPLDLLAVGQLSPVGRAFIERRDIGRGR